MRLANIPEEYWKARFEDNDAKKCAYYREISLYIEAIVRNLHDGVGLLLWGPMGHGKTHLACSVLKKGIAHNAYGLYVEASQVAKAVIEKTPGLFEGQTLQERLETVDLLVIDDLGSEHTSTFDKRCVENLMRFRVTRKKSTVLTTNLTLEELGTVYGRGLATVLREKVYPVKVVSHDWREDKALALRERFA